MTGKNVHLTFLSWIAAALLATPGVAEEDRRGPQQDNAAPTDRQPMQAHLGIRVAPLPPALTSHLPDVIGNGRGILISDVTEGSPADQAGLKQHDVLIRYDDQDLYSPEQLVKRVRNDKAGKTIELEYVRGGKRNTASVTLGAKPMQAPIESNWPGFTERFDVPLVPQKPDFLTEQQDRIGNGTQWTRFESLSVIKQADGTYQAKVTYKGEDGNSIEREYSGTRQQLRSAIESDQELPASQKQQLLRSLDDRGEGVFPRFKLPGLPNWRSWGQELFDLPDVSF